MTELNYPNISIYEMLKKSVNLYSKNISYNYFGNKQTYKGLLDEVDRCANALVSIGIKPGDRVTICMPNTPEAVVCFYAINKIKAISNMIHPLSSETEIKGYFCVSDSHYVVAIDAAMDKIEPLLEEMKIKCCIVVSPSDSLPFLKKTAYRMSHKSNKYSCEWKKFISEGKKKSYPENYAGPNDVATILYSGGTSGNPKGIELTNMNFNALAMQGFTACECLKERDKVLGVMPVFHGFGLGICIHTTLFFGGEIVLIPRFQMKQFHNLLHKYRPNIIAGVPTLYEALLRDEKIASMNLSFLKCVISGGDSLSVNLKKKVDVFLKEHGADVQIREGYGLTECVTGSCLTPTNYYKEGSIGLPYPDTIYKIVKPGTTEILPANTEGEIILTGPTVMKGYLNNPGETEKTLRTFDGHTWLYTGDAGCMDEEGFIYFKYRLKRIIMSSGYCIYPQNIENLIDGCDGVLMSCVVGIEHEYRGQVPKAYIVLQEGVDKSEKLYAIIKNTCEKNLARYAWPYSYEFTKELPKTLVGKIAYGRLMESKNEISADTSGNIPNKI